MKVINLILDARVGGPQVRIAEVGKRLFEYGIDTVAVFPRNHSGFFQTILKERNIRAVPLRLHKLSKKPWALLKFFLFFVPETIRLARFFKREQPALVHCTGSWQWKGILAAKLARVKSVWHLNDTAMPRIVRWVFRFLNRYPDGFIVEGTKVKKYYLDTFALKKTVRIIQAPVDTEVFDPGQEIEPEEKIAGKKGVKIVTVANLNYAKGLEHFIDTVALLNAEYKDLHFYVVGDTFSTQKAYAEKLFQKVREHRLENLVFFGPSPRIPSILKAADIYMCSSVFEASPQSVWEAMAMERPIVSTDVGAVPDFIHDGENGFIVSTRNPEALAEKIGLLVDDPGLRNTFGKKARDIAVKELDVKIAAKKHDEIYREIVGDLVSFKKM